MNAPLKPLRRNVCAVLTDPAEARVLVFRRVEWPTFPNPWQFPQGGLEPGETPEQGLRRELREEIGTDAIDLLRSAGQPVIYEWPPEVVATLTGDRSKLTSFRGQEQYWFLAALHDGTGGIRFDHQPQEFDAFEWVTPQEAIRRVVPFKRQAYVAGLTALGLVEPGLAPERAQ